MTYYEEHKEEMKDYQNKYNHMKERHGRRFKTILKLSKIEPTEEELGWLEEASLICAKNMNKHRVFGKVDPEDILAQCYEGLLIALNNYNPEKNYNKRRYVLQKIKFHMIDEYRKEYGRNNLNGSGVDAKKMIFPNIGSLDTMEYRSTGEDVNVEEFVKEFHEEDLDIPQESKYFLRKIREGFFEYESYYRNHSIDKLYAMWYMRNMQEKPYKEIGEILDLSESMISQVFNDSINLIFDEIKEQLRKDNPSNF